jgi:hypothetical protein
MPAGIMAQRILLLENQSTLKNYKYYEGETFTFRYNGFDEKISDQIVVLRDSSVVFEMMGEMKFSDIGMVYRENWLVKTFSALSLIGGSAYFGLDTFNRLINNDAPVVLAETAMISGGLVVLGAALLPFRSRKIVIGDNWKLKTLDPYAF